MSEIKKNGAASEGVSGNTQSAEQLNAAPNLAEQAESSAQRNQAYLKKKQAEMEHAELYRQRLRADKERRQALAAQRKANKEKAAAKAEAERRAREEEELARQKAIQDNTEEAERRNAEKDSYLERVSAKRAENEKAAEDYKNAQEEAEREMAERIKEAKKNAENAKSSPAAKPAASASDNAPDLSDDSDTLTISFDEYNDDNTGGDEDEINVIDSGAQGSENESGNAADSDMILTIDPNEIPGLSDDNNGKKAEPKPQAAPQPKPQAAPQPKPQPQQPPMAPKAPKTKKSKPKARTPMDPMKAYLLGSSTYDLVTKETDFGKAHEEKKQKAKPAVDKSPIPPIKIGSTAGQYKYSSSTEVPSFDTGKKKGKKSVKPIAKGGDGDDESNLVPSLGAVSAVGAAGAITAALAIAGAATDKELSAAQTPSGSASAPAAIRSDSLVGDDNTGLSPDTFEGSENAGSATDHIDGAALSHAIEQDDANRSAYEAGTAASDNNSYADEADRAAEAALLYSMSRRDSDSDAVSDMDKLNEEAEALSSSSADEAEAQKRDSDSDAVANMDERNEEVEALSSSSADEAEAQKRDSDSGAVANMDERNEEAEALSSDGNDENKKKDDELSAEAIKKFENDKDSENDSEELSDKDESETDEDRIKKFEEARDKDDDAASTAEKEDEKDSESDVNKLEKDSDKKEADDAAAKKADDEEGARQLAEYERIRDKEKEIRDTASEVKKSEDEALNDAKEYSKKNAKDSDNAALRAFDERNFTRSDYSEILAEEKARREKVCVDDSDIAVAALALDRDEFDRYAAAAESYEDTLFEDEARARDRQHKYGGDMSILMLKECMDIERELLISHTDMLRRAIISENGKYYKIYSEKIEKMLIEYNADIFFWNEYTGEHVARIPDTYLSHVKNGQRLTTVPAVRIPPHIAAKLPYASSRTEEAANKAGASVAPATQGISTQTPLVEADRFPVLEILKETEALNDEATLILSTEGGKSSYSFKDYFRRASAFETELTETEQMLREKQQKQNGVMEMVFLRECIDIERKLLESYVQSYKCAVKSNNGSIAKEYIEKIEDSVKEYNADLAYWSSLTGTKPQIIPSSFTSSLRSKKTVPLFIPVVSLPSSVESRLRRRNAMYKRTHLAHTDTTENNGLFDAILAKSLFSATEEKAKTILVDTTDANLTEQQPSGESIEEFTERYERAIAERIAGKTQAAHDARKPAAETTSVYEPTDDDREIGELYLFGKGHIFEGIDKRASVVARSGGRAAPQTTVASASKAANATKSFIAAGIFADPAELDMGMLRAIYSKDAIRQTNNEIKSAKHNAVLDPEENTTISDYDKAIDRRDRERDYAEASTSVTDAKDLAAYKEAEKRMDKRAENAELFATVSKLRDDAAIAAYNKAREEAEGVAEMAAATAQITVDAELTETIKAIEDKQAEKAALAATAAATAEAATLAAYDKAQDAAAGLAEMTSSISTTQAMLDAELTSTIKALEDKQAEKAALAATAAATEEAATLAAYDRAQDVAAGLVEMAATTVPTQATVDTELTSTIKAIEDKQAEKAALAATAAATAEAATLAAYDKAQDAAAGLAKMAAATVPTQAAVDSNLTNLIKSVEDKQAEKAALAATAAATAEAAALAAYDKAQEKSTILAEMDNTASPTQVMLDAELTGIIRAVENKQEENAALAATAAATAEAATLAAYDKAQDAAAGLAEMTSSTSTTQAMLDAELTSTIKALEDKQAEKAALAATAAATAEAATLAAYDKAQDAAAGLAEMAAATVPTQAAVDSDLTRAIKAAEDKQAENAALATAAKEAKVADANSAYDAKMAKKAAKSSANLYGADSDGIALAKIDEKISKANEVTKPVSKRDALVEEVNKLMEATAASALAAKVLEKKLAESSRLEKEVICKIRALRKTMRSAKQNGRAIYLKECLEQEAKLIELYYEDYKLAKSANVKKQIKSYRKKIIHCVREYNIDTTHFTTLTGTHNTRISENFMERIDAEIFALPTLIVPDYLASHTALAEVKEFAEAEAQKAILSDSTTSIAKRLEREALDEEIKKADAEKVERDYERSLTHAERDKAYKTVAAAPASPLDIAAILETTTNKKLKKLELLAIDKRRRDEENIRSFNAAAAKDEKKQRERAEEKEVRRIMAEDYEQRTAIDAYNKKLEALEQTNPELISEDARRELLLAAERLSENESFTALARRELRRYIRDEKKDEKSIIKDIRRTRKKYNNATVRKIALPYLRESIGFVHELLERYVETFKAAVIARHKKYTKIYEKKTSLLLDEYRADLDLWKNVTGESVPAIPLSVIEDVKMGREIAPIPKLDEELVLTPKNERRLKKLDLLNFIKAEKKREKRAKEHEKEMREMTMDDGEHIVISKFHMDTDLDTVKSRIEFRKERYINDLRLMRFRFGEETPKEMRKHRGEITKLAKMKRHGKRYVKYTKRNNERYLKIANLDLKPLYSKSDVHKERLEILQNRIRNLLIQRDEVNMRLLTLYAEENANPEKKRRTNKRRISKVKLKAAKRAFKKQFKLYKLASKYRVPEAEKQRIYEIMNRRIDLRTYLAECKFRKRHEHPSAFKARRVLRQQIKDTKLRLKYADRDFKKFMRKASKRSARTPNPKIQILWCFVLLTMAAIIGGGVYLFMTYKDLIFAYFNGFIAYMQQMISNFGGGV